MAIGAIIGSFFIVILLLEISENKNTSIEVLLFVKQASLIKETTKSFQVLSGFGFPLHRFVPFRRMRRGRYAEFPPLTFVL